MEYKIAFTCSIIYIDRQGCYRTILRYNIIYVIFNYKLQTFKFDKYITYK